MDHPTERSLELEAEASPPDHERRRGRLALGVALIALVALGTVAALRMATGGGGDGTDDALLRDALRNTGNTDTFALHIEERLEGFEVVGDGRVDGARSSVSMRTRSAMLAEPLVLEQLQIDGVVLVREDGVWKEWPRRDDGEDTDPRAELDGMVAAVETRDAVELERHGAVVEYEVGCTPDALGSSTIEQACHFDPTVRIRITIDAASRTVHAFRIDGDVPVYPGRSERGYIEVVVTPGVSDPIERPATVDRRGVECLADDLGLADPTSGAVGLAIRDWDTDQISDLYGRCGFESWPPGKDFGVR
jgi:hypothetical protein